MDTFNTYAQPTYNNGAAMYAQPMYYATTIVPQNNPSLTAEEIKMIATQNPSKIDITITEVDKLRAICNHKDQNHVDRVVQINDGSGDVFCPLCNYRWSPENLSKEEVKELCDKLIASMQNAKWVGDYGIQLTRDYFAMIPLLEKFPDLYEYAMKQFNKYCNTNGYNNANDAAIYNQYNSLMGYATPNYNYAPQPQVQVMPSYGSVANLYVQPQGGPATDVNPMQAVYGYAPQPQAVQAMPSYAPVANPYMNAPQYGPINPTPGVPTAPQPTYSPAQVPQAQTPQGTTVTENNGTTTSETPVKIS